MTPCKPDIFQRPRSQKKALAMIRFSRSSWGSFTFVFPQHTMHEPMVNAGTLPKVTKLSKSVTLFLLGVGYIEGFPGGSDGKEFSCKAGHQGLILGSGRSPGEGNGYPLQYSCLENTLDRLWGTLEGDKKKSKGKGTGLSMKDSTDKWWVFQLNFLTALRFHEN